MSDAQAAAQQGQQGGHGHDDHRHGHAVTIIVNGRPKEVDEKELSFDDIVQLAFDNPPSGPNVTFTITYRKGPDSHKEGTLVEGGTVKVKDGMIFNVTATDKS